MTRLYLVRHGTAEAGFADHHDPGLAPIGRTQAEEVGERLGQLGPLPIVTSPLRRARETAVPLARRWEVDPVVVPEVGEIPTPTDDLDGRAEWLRQAMTAGWSQLSPTIGAWRSALLAALAALDHDTVVFTHFVAINAVVGAAAGTDQVVTFRPANASSTIVEFGDDGRPVVLALGDQGITEVR